MWVSNHKRTFFTLTLLVLATSFCASAAEKDAFANDPRLRLPTGLAFFRYCSFMLGNSSLQVVATDHRVSGTLQYYSEVDSNRLDDLLARFRDDAIYVRGKKKFIGISELKSFFAARLQRLSGVHEILSVSVKENQIFVHGKFTGSDEGRSVSTDFIDYWVLDATGRVYFRQSWIDEPLSI